MQIAFMAFQGAQDDGIYLQNATSTNPQGAEAFWYDRIGVEGFGTSTRPALVQIGSHMVMGWKGIANDSRIFLSSYNGNPTGPMPDPGLSVTPAMANWTTEAPFVGANGSPAPGTSFGPSLTNWYDYAIMLWVAAGDTSVWYTTFDPMSPLSVTQMPTNIRSQFTPAIVSYFGTLIAVWRGEGDIDGLYWATTQDPSNWIHHGPIADCASSFQPSLCLHYGQIFLTFKGPGDDTGIYMTQIANPADLATNSAGWNYRWSISNVGTSHGPSLCTSNGQLFMAWKGNPGDTSIWYSSSPSGLPGSWSPQQVIGTSPNGKLNYGTSVGPALATLFA